MRNQVDKNPRAHRGVHATGRVSRDLVAAVEAERGRGIVRATRVQAGGFVAHTALMTTAMLSAEEANAIQMAPLGEDRYKAIVDAYTMYSVGEIADMRGEW